MTYREAGALRGYVRRRAWEEGRLLQEKHLVSGREALGAFGRDGLEAVELDT